MTRLSVLILLLLFSGAQPAELQQSPISNPPQAVQNLILNPGFESGFDNWGQSTLTNPFDPNWLTISNTIVHSGSSALKVDETEQRSFASVHQSVTIPFQNTEISFWFYPESPEYIMGFASSASGVAVNSQLTLDNGDVRLEMRQSGFVNESSGGATDLIIPGTWNEIVIRVDGPTRTQTVFVNGEEAFSVTALFDFTPSDGFGIGDFHSVNYYGTAYYDDVSVVENPTTQTCDLGPDPVLAVEDEMFNDADWVSQITVNTRAPVNPWSLDRAEQSDDTGQAGHPAAGNPAPGRWTRYSYTGTAGLGATVQTAHWYTQSIVPPEGGLTAIQVDFDTWGGGQRAGALIYQDSTFYRGPSPTLPQNPDWAPYSSGCLSAGDFLKQVGPGPNEPDFSRPFAVGYNLLATTSASPSLRDHLIDNFRVFTDAPVTLGDALPVVDLPVGSIIPIDDDLVADDDEPQFLQVLNNDIIEEGTSVEIVIVDPPENGQILSIEADGIWYQRAEGFEGEDRFTYTLATTNEATGKRTEGEGIAWAILQAIFCSCIFAEADFDCQEESAGGVADQSSPVDQLSSAALTALLGSTNAETLLRWRDEVLRSTDDGDALFEDILFNSPEILRLALFERPALQEQIGMVFSMAESPTLSLLDGDGSEVITQEQMDAVDVLFEELSASASARLYTTIQGHREALGDLDRYVGLTVKDAFEVYTTGTRTSSEYEQPVATFALEQSFPNPFTDATSIRFSLEEPSLVTLEIFDLHGRLVRLLHSGSQNPGSHAAQWDGTDGLGSPVPAGLYFVRLTTSAGSTTRSVVATR